MPAAQFAQKQVGIMAGLINIVQYDRTAHFARIVHNQITKAQQALRNAGRNSYILDFAERDVTSSARNQARVDFHFGVSERVANHVAFEMKVSGKQEQRQSQRDRNKR